MNAITYYLQLSQFLLSIKPNVSLMTSSYQESQDVLAAIDHIYSLVQIQMQDIQSVTD